MTIHLNPVRGARAAGLTMLILSLTLLAGCSSIGKTPPRNPVGETFPTVSGTALDGKTWTLPKDFSGKPVVLLVGYVMDAQFDLDRWLLGLQQLGTPVAAAEVPTVQGMVPGMIAGTINEGMRSGIPPTDWKSVITIYADADKLASFTGDENPRNGRVLLLNGQGRVVWFADHGFSAAGAAQLDREARALAGEGK